MSDLRFKTFDPKREVTVEHPTRADAIMVAIRLAKMRGIAYVHCIEDVYGHPELVGQITIEDSDVGFAFCREGRTS